MYPSRNRTACIGRAVMKSFLFSAIVLCVCFTSVQAQSLKGDWQGSLSFNGQQFGIILHITSESDSRVEGNLDIPQQGALGLKFDAMEWRNDTLFGSMASVQSRCFLVQAGADSLVGTWFQNGVEAGMKLKRSAEELGPERPQHPKPPFPYDQREVVFQGADGSQLAGTLVLPHGAKPPFSAVVMVSGSGPQDRDESLFGHKPFLVIADYLARQGIASLRYDERGVGESHGTFVNATTTDFLQDAEKAVQFLREQQHINSQYVGVVGHSEGGVIATKMAASGTVDFGFALAGSAIRGDSLLLVQSELIFGASGMGSLLQVQLDLQREVFEAVTSNSDSVQREKAIHEAIALVGEKHGQQSLQMLGLNEAGMQQYVAQVSQPWMVEFLQLHPLDGIESIDVPFAFAFGGKDVQVPAKHNITALEESGILEASTLVKIHEYPNLNHLFQNAKTGLPSEYANIKETIDESVLKDLVALIKHQ